MCGFFFFPHHQCGVVGVRQLSTTHAARGLEEFFPAGPANEHADAGERQFILVSLVVVFQNKSASLLPFSPFVLPSYRMLPHAFKVEHGRRVTCELRATWSSINSGTFC